MDNIKIIINQLIIMSIIIAIKILLIVLLKNLIEFLKYCIVIIKFYKIKSKIRISISIIRVCLFLFFLQINIYRY
jgi:hypothetical protein